MVIWFNTVDPRSYRRARRRIISKARNLWTEIIVAVMPVLMMPVLIWNKEEEGTPFCRDMLVWCSTLKPSSFSAIFSF